MRRGFSDCVLGVFWMFVFIKFVVLLGVFCYGFGMGVCGRAGIYVVFV